jgi:hypothetical protein
MEVIGIDGSHANFYQDFIVPSGGLLNLVGSENVG